VYHWPLLAAAGYRWLWHGHWAAAAPRLRSPTNSGGRLPPGYRW